MVGRVGPAALESPPAVRPGLATLEFPLVGWTGLATLESPLVAWTDSLQPARVPHAQIELDTLNYIFVVHIKAFLQAPAYRRLRLPEVGWKL